MYCLTYFDGIRVTSFHMPTYGSRLPPINPDSQLQMRFAAGLERLSLKSDILLRRLPDISFPKLTHFKASDCSIYYLTQLMRDSPLLRSCYFEFVEGGTPVNVPNLNIQL